MINAFIHTVAAFLLCLVSTPLVRSIATRKGWVAAPSKERWHKKPTALMGGIAIYLGIAAPIIIIGDFQSLSEHILKTSATTDLPSLSAVLCIGVTFLFLLGLVDDYLNIKPHTKLVGQILVASMVTFFGFRLHWFTSLTLDTMITIFWIVGITNAFNLIDNMDGLCAGVGAVSAICFAFIFMGSSLEAMQVSMILAASLVAFLFYNFNPASIFMGDCGSLIIGFSLSMLGLYYSESAAQNTLSLYVVPTMILMVPILDTTMVTAIRLLSGRKAFAGGKDHTSHRLILIGMNEKRAVLFLYATGAVSGMAAVFVNRTDTYTSPTVIIPVAVSLLLMGIYLAQLRVYPEKEFSFLQDKPFTPILVELTYKRQILLVILDFFLVSFAYYLSYRLRFDAATFSYYFKVFLTSLPAIIGCKLAAFFALGVYRVFWGYLSANDVYTYIKASSIGSIVSVAVVTYIYRLEDFSEGILLIDWLLTTGFLLGTRGSFRLFLDSMKRKTLAGESVFIYGAGRGGEILLREILNNKKMNIKPLGFIDDNPLKKGKKLQGYPVLGTFNELESLCRKHRPGGLLVSFQNNDLNNHTAIKAFCKANDIFLKHFVISLENVDLEP